MVRMECKKIFVKQKALIYLTLILFMKLINIFASGYDSNYMIDENESYYLEYMDQYEGKITEDTRNKIEQEYDRIYHQTDHDYLSSSSEKAFQVIYHQYTYEEESGGGYIFDSRGWETLLQHNNVDYILLVGIIILAVLVFATEYENDMQNLMLTTKKGRSVSVHMKLWIGICGAAMLTLIFQLCQCIYLYLKVGLPHGNYPLICLEFFEHTGWNCKLWQAYGCILLLKVLGAVFASIAAMVVVILVKHTVLSMVVSTAGWLITDIVLGQGTTAYRTPLGLLKAAGYFWPDQYVSAVSSSGDFVKKYTFHEIPQGRLPAYILCFIIIIAVLYMLSVLRYLKYPVKRIFSYQKKRILSVFLVCLSVTALGGCGPGRQEAQYFKVSEDSQDEYNGTDFHLKIDHDNNNIIYTDNSGTTYDLIRDVFPLQTEISRIFVDGNLCYYLMENENDNGIYIRCIDLDTFSDQFIYSDMEENTEDLYSLLSDDKSVEEIFENLDSTKCFFVTKHYIYLNKENYIRKINRLTHYSKVVAEEVADKEITYDNGTLSYTDFHGKVINLQE